MANKSLDERYNPMLWNMLGSNLLVHVIVPHVSPVIVTMLFSFLGVRRQIHCVRKVESTI